MSLFSLDVSIAALLTQDGLMLGAIYALLALSILLVFTVTRIIFVAQGEFVAFGALTLAALQQGVIPGTAWLTLLLGAVVMVVEVVAALRAKQRHRVFRYLIQSAVVYLALPLALLGTTAAMAPTRPSLPIQIALTLALMMPIGPMIYRLAFQPVMAKSILVKLFVAVAVHYVLLGLGLTFFGAEGWRTSPFTTAVLPAGAVDISGQNLWVLASSAVMMLGLWLFFSRTIRGKALRATAVNRIGSRLVGIRTDDSGRLVFLLAALFGAFSGILIAPVTTIYYDSGFLIVLKGIVGSVIGGMVSYPLAAAGAIFVGVVEAFASFFASGYKEAILFSVLIPVLLWRSLTLHSDEEEV